MPQDRPRIPAETQKLLLIEAGHRCCACGAELPLERAHIVPWSRSRDHSLANLICLCANCHARADSESWGEEVLRQYKEQPWVLSLKEISGRGSRARWAASGRASSRMGASCYPPRKEAHGWARCAVTSTLRRMGGGDGHFDRDACATLSRGGQGRRGGDNERNQAAGGSDPRLRSCLRRRCSEALAGPRPAGASPFLGTSPRAGGEAGRRRPCGVAASLRGTLRRGHC